MVTKPQPVCLVVEPEHGMRMLLDDILSVSKVQVIACEGEVQAIKAVEVHKEINVIVCPAPAAGTKNTLVSKIRDKYPELAVVCLSPSAGLPERSQAFEQGASEYLVRPVSPVTLADRVTWWAARGHRPFLT